MELDDEERPQIGPKLTVYIGTEFDRLKGIPPPEDPDEQEYMTHVAFWKAVLGVHPDHRTMTTRTEAILGVHPDRQTMTTRTAESYRSLIESALKNETKYIEENNDYYRTIKKWNEKLWNETDNDDDTLSFVDILPRSPSPRCFHSWHRQFRMTNTNPTSVRSMRFTQPGVDEYASSELLQFFSLRFAGDFSHAQRMSVYGFVAVRDDVDKLRNYIFNRSREHAQGITPDSPNLSLIPPTRGISAPHDVIVEYNLKVKGNGGDAKDGVLIDGCFMFRETSGWEVTVRQVRLFGPLGPLNLHFVFMKFAVEATIVVKVKRAMPGYSLSIVAATTCGSSDEIILYDCSAHSLAPMEPKDGGLSSSVVAVAHAVVAVELGCNLKLRFGISSEEEESVCGFGRHCRKSSHELLFTAQRHKTSKGAIVMGRMFKVATKVTWSTMGRPYLPIFDSEKRSLLGDPNGPCDI